MKSILRLNIIPNGSTAFNYPDIFNKHLESLKSPKNPDEGFLVLTYEDYKIHLRLKETFFFSLRANIIYDIAENMDEKLETNSFYTPDEDLVTYFMIDEFKNMNFNDFRSINPYIFSLVNFFINKVDFKIDLFEIIDKLTKDDLEMIYRKLSVLNLPFFNRDLIYFQQKMKIYKMNLRII